jgi:hypothetical protein
MNCIRSYATKIFIAAVLGYLFFVVPATAQQRFTTAKVSIPFDCWSGDKKFPAGDYTLDSSVPTFVTIRSKDGKINEQVATILYDDPVNRSDAKLLFISRDGKFYLTELWGVLGKRVMTSEFGRNSKSESKRREVRITYP